MKLGGLRAGQRAWVVNVKGPRELKRRLWELGFTRGVAVLAVKNAGGVVEVEIRGSRLAIRGADADAVEVEKGRCGGCDGCAGGKPELR